MSSVTVIPSEIPHHHHHRGEHRHTNDMAKYQLKYKRLKQLVKETIFVSDRHYCSIVSELCGILHHDSCHSEVVKEVSIHRAGLALCIGYRCYT